MKEFVILYKFSMNHGKLNGLEDILRKLGIGTIHIEILPESYYVEYIKDSRSIATYRAERVHLAFFKVKDENLLYYIGIGPRSEKIERFISLFPWKVKVADSKFEVRCKERKREILVSFLNDAYSSIYQLNDIPKNELLEDLMLKEVTKKSLREFCKELYKIFGLDKRYFRIKLVRESKKRKTYFVGSNTFVSHSVNGNKEYLAISSRTRVLLSYLFYHHPREVLERVISLSYRTFDTWNRYLTRRKVNRLIDILYEINKNIDNLFNLVNELSKKI